MYLSIKFCSGIEPNQNVLSDSAASVLFVLGSISFKMYYPRLNALTDVRWISLRPRIESSHTVSTDFPHGVLGSAVPNQNGMSDPTQRSLNGHV